jgi:hypothetical protein
MWAKSAVGTGRRQLLGYGPGKGARDAAAVNPWEKRMLTWVGIFMIVAAALLSNKEQRKRAWLLAAAVIILVIIADRIR